MLTFLSLSLHAVNSDDDGEAIATGGPEMKFFNSSLPSNKLQSHDFVHYVGEVVNPGELE